MELKRGIFKVKIYEAVGVSGTQRINRRILQHNKIVVHILPSSKLEIFSSTLNFCLLR
jgi:hypothetical protein